MKNKSKLKKIKAQKNTGTPVPAQWLYLCPQEITVRDIWKLFQVTDESATSSDQITKDSSSGSESVSSDSTNNSLENNTPASALKNSEVISDTPEVEIWEAAGVLEITLSNGKTIDFETAPLDLRDDYSNRFLAKHQTRALFYVTIKPDSFSLAKPVMESVTAKLQGIFCGDTDDFTPVIKACHTKK